MTLHEERAAEIVADLACDRQTEVLATDKCGRQGDVICTREGNSKAAGPATGPQGWMVAAGAHGEHRIVADSLVMSESGDLMDLADGGVLVHTDAPEARHDPIRLAPGCWRVYREQELSLDKSIVPVQD
jgi:hypothetical protein